MPSLFHPRAAGIPAAAMLLSALAIGSAANPPQAAAADRARASLHLRGGSSRGGIKSSHPGAALKAYLPSFSAASAPNLPSVITEVKPLPEGTYKPTLAYPDQVQRDAIRQAKSSGPVAAVTGDIQRILDIDALWKALAAASVLMLVAAHLRAWVDVDGRVDD